MSEEICAKLLTVPISKDGLATAADSTNPKSACHPASAFSVSLFSAIDAYTTVLDFFKVKSYYNSISNL